MVTVGRELDGGSLGLRSKPGPFAKKKNAKSPAPSRAEIVMELNTGAARNVRPPAVSGS